MVGSGESKKLAGISIKSGESKKYSEKILVRNLLFNKKMILNDLASGLKIMQWCILFCFQNVEKIVRKKVIGNAKLKRQRWQKSES